MINYPMILKIILKLKTITKNATTSNAVFFGSLPARCAAIGAEMDPPIINPSMMYQ